jgi:ribosome biogenesis GTPase
LSTHDSPDPSLVRLGWSPCFQDSFAALGDATLSPARVAEEHRDGYVVFAGADELRADVAGRLRHDARGREALPAVGDWVAVEARRPERRATIRHVLPRRGALVRKAAGRTSDAQVVAANLDVVYVVTSANQDFNAARLARFLAAAWESGARPVVLVAKADLAEDVDALVGEAAAAAPGADVHAVSSVDGRGLDALASHLAPGRTAAFVGSSGVGKSTLVNRLLGEERLATTPVRDHDDRGRHTTTRRQLIALPSGALVVDTPGMREFGLLDADDGLSAAFADVEELADSCRFRDCRHGAEPGCAVLAAVESGALPRDRHEQWLSLGRELAFQRRKEDVRAMIEERKRWKAISKAARARNKQSGGKRTGVE